MVAAVGLTMAFGQTRIRPYVTGEVIVLATPITENITGTVDLFDPGVPHSLTVELTDAEYREMLSAYVRDGAKKWVSADITLDGTVIRDVAVRLKGNSTLMGLRGDGPPGPPGAGGPGGPGKPPMPDEFFKTMMSMAASAEDPTSLPLLISFDENAAGRAYQGLTELSVRPGAPVLNEALALSLTADSGQPTQRYTYATYTLNGQRTTRLLLEHPDDGYANALFDSPGYLYKADAKSRLEFAGPDQSAYAHRFTQINAVGTGNLQPIVDFAEWLQHAEQAEFDASLADWVDVDSLARYLATQNLLVNGDDMGGPGQNYYLWYDLTAKRFSVISWDLNLAMVGDPATAPHDKVELKIPEGAEPPPGADGRRPPLGGNLLKDKFLASTAWAPTYDEKYAQLYRQLFADGHAHARLEGIAARVPLSDGLDEPKLREAVASMHRWLDKRVAALESAAQR